ncbi:predicted sugar phosphatases of the HAD superfamily [Bellilinea caldifistulae]|nr:HAD-IIA family hydrolase [Bellilinea caldifistulae]GAP11057.1 predicted sugar phosphatases of the HAD superfamily [Bellilinea caldifistulae]
MLLNNFPQIKALILDMDGVLWRGKQPIGDLARIFERIQNLGLKYTFATNNATGSIGQYVDKLRSFGVDVQPQQIINSPIAVAHYLKQLHPEGGAVYLIGETGLIEALEQAGFHHAEDGVVAVVAGLDRQFTYEKLRKASLLIQKGIPFIGTNPDKTFPSPEGLTPGAGSILAAIETASGTPPQIMGKPYPHLFQLALQRMGTQPHETLVIGDRLDTDILGGMNAGCKTALVLSGVTGLAEAEQFQPKPDWIASSLGELVGVDS